MNKANGPVDRIKTALAIVLLAGLTGCWGTVGPGYVSGGYEGVVVVPGPDLYLFGGGYDRGRDVHDYSHRGFESRGVAHPEIRAPARPGGGHEGKR